MSNTNTVSSYLISRLTQLGIAHLFSVPGDYTSDFLLDVDEADSIQRIGNCNELNAGYAADGYARANGLAAVAVTTGVGSLSVLNAVGGSYVERVPVVVVIGTLSNTKLLSEKYAGELFHHNLRLGIDNNRIIYEQVTVAYELISNPATAPAQIDSALTACITQSRPVAIEIMEDCYNMPCAAPAGTLSPQPLYTDFGTLQSMAATNVYAGQIVNAVNNAVTETIKLLQAAKYPVLWIGKEVSIYGLAPQVTELIDLLNANWAGSLLGKAALDETTGNYIGTYDGAFTTAQTQAYINQSDCLIAIGVWSTDLNEFSRTPIVMPQVWASHETVKTPAGQYIQVSLQNYLQQLLIALRLDNGFRQAANPVKPAALPQFPPFTAITYDYFFIALDSFITTNNFLVADIGLSTFGGASYVKIARPGGFLCQAIWASIGWSVPAGLGASFTPGVRPVVVVGDGAFKLTCQEISTMVQQNCNTVIFVLNNGVYAVEQMLLDPAPFEYGSNAAFEAANVLQPWDYTMLLNGFSNNSPNALSAAINTIDDTAKVFAAIDNAPNAVWLVSVNLNMRNYPSSWQPFVPTNK